MRGRRPAGPEYVQRLPGSPEAKRRLQILLEVNAGVKRVQEACAELGICEQRFHQLREQAFAAALVGLEPGLPGRPPRVATPEQQQVEALEAELVAKAVELRATQAREEIALTLPRLGQPASAEKKTTRHRRARRARPGKKPHT